MLSSVKSWWSNAGQGEIVNKTDLEEEIKQSEKPCESGEIINMQEQNDSNEESINQKVQNDEIQKALNAAKDWSNYLFALGKTATETAAKNVSTTAKYLAEQINENDLLDKTPVLGDFNREQARFIAEQQKSGLAINPDVACMTSGHLPWADCETEDEINSLRSQVLELTNDERVFIRKPPQSANFEFTMATFQQAALALLNEDPQLSKMRFRLVPRRIKEDTFWKNYFYRISLLKQSARLRSVTTSSSSQPKAVADDNNAYKSESSNESYDRLSDFDDVKEPQATISEHPSAEEFASHTDVNHSSDSHLSAAELHQLGVGRTTTSDQQALNNDWDDDLQKEFELLDNSSDQDMNIDDDELERELAAI